MKPENHVIASIAISGLLYAATRSPEAAAASLATGILLDLDHVLDYWRECGFNLDVRSFFEACNDGRLRRVVLILHGWEWFIGWACVALLSKENPWILGLMVGHAHHMLLDQVGNGPGPWGYWLSWRWSRGFAGVEIFESCRRMQRGRRPDTDVSRHPD